MPPPRLRALSCDAGLVVSAPPVVVCVEITVGGQRGKQQRAEKQREYSRCSCMLRQQQQRQQQARPKGTTAREGSESTGGGEDVAGFLVR